MGAALAHTHTHNSKLAPFVCHSNCSGSTEHGKRGTQHKRVTILYHHGAWLVLSLLFGTSCVGSAGQLYFPVYLCGLSGGKLTRAVSSIRSYAQSVQSRTCHQRGYIVNLINFLIDALTLQACLLLIPGQCNLRQRACRLKKRC